MENVVEMGIKETIQRARAVVVGMHPIVTVQNKRLDMIENLV